MARVKQIGLAVLAVLTFILIVQNMEVVSFRLFFWTLTLSRIVLLPLLVAIGFMAGTLSAKLRTPGKKDAAEKQDKTA